MELECELWSVGIWSVELWGVKLDVEAVECGDLQLES